MKSGALMHGAIIAENEKDWIQKNLGDFGVQKVLALSEGFSSSKRNDFSVLGGFCSVSTHEVLLMNKGFCSDRFSGKRKLIRSSNLIDIVEDITLVSLQHILEAVGISRYPTVVISESKLWCMKIEQLLQKLDIYEASIDKIHKFIDESDTRMLKYLTNAFSLLYEGNIPSRIKDYDMWNDLLDIRSRLFGRYKMPVPFDTYSMVYAGMYSGLYSSVLKAKKILPKNSLVAIYEPISHASYEKGVRADFIGKMISPESSDLYLKKGGVNQEIGFIAFQNLIDSRGKEMKKYLAAAFLPNEINYFDFDFSKFPLIQHPGDRSMEFLDDISNIDLKQNPAFMWATNLLPTAQLLSIVSKMIILKDRFLKEKLELKGIQDSNVDLQKEISKVKKGDRNKMGELAEELISELQRQVKHIFGN